MLCLQSDGLECPAAEEGAGVGCLEEETGAGVEEMVVEAEKEVQEVSSPHKPSPRCREYL